MIWDRAFIQVRDTNRRYHLFQVLKSQVCIFLILYENHPIIKKLIEKSCDCDYIIAPIADNRMFQIINSFIMGEITDEQCKHCLAATNLGYQYVFKSDKAIKSLKMLERCYISEKEKEYYKKMRNSDAKLGDDKVKLARIKYRGKGRYIDEILK